MTIDRMRVRNFLIFIALGLILIHCIILSIYYYIGDPVKFNFIRMFDLDMERNIPTLFSSILLLMSGYLFYILSKVQGTETNAQRRYWLGLSYVFIFLGFDESVKLHEQLGDLTKKYIHFDGYLYYPWVVSYGILVVILVFIYFRFFLQMERKVFWSFMAAATIFLSGAIGFELLGANEVSLHGTTTIRYSIYYTIEESLEMFGVIYLIDILLKLLDKTKIIIKA